MEQYITFQKFNQAALAEDLMDILTKNDIGFELEDASPTFDPIFVNSELTREYRVKLLKDDFEKAEKLLQSLNQEHIGTVDRSHYLFEFSDDELFEVLLKKDEWNDFDYALARKILLERGREISPETLDALKAERLRELARPEGSQRTWILIGYLTALLGGFLGIFIGWHLSSFRKTLPDGNRVYAYSNADRKQGSRIFVLGVIVMAAWVLYRVSRISKY